MASIDFSHLNRQVGSCSTTSLECTNKILPFPVSTNAIASKLIENSLHCNVDREVSREINAEIANLRTCFPTDNSLFIKAFTKDEMAVAVKQLKSGKVQDPDKMVREFVINCGTQMLAYLGEFFFHCMSNLHFHNIRHQADGIAIIKPNKPASRWHCHHQTK